MRIPILPMTSDGDNEVLMGRVQFDGFTPSIKGDAVMMTLVRQKSGTSEEEKGTALVMDVKGLQRGNIDEVVLKRLRIRGMRTWFLTNIETVEDVFDAFNTDADAVLVPTHTVRSEDEFEDILAVSDSAIPAVFVRDRRAVFIGEDTEFRRAVDRVFDYGYVTVAVFDLDDSVSEENWSFLKERGDIIPCSFTGKIKGERFEELGFERCFTVPE